VKSFERHFSSQSVPFKQRQEIIQSAFLTAENTENAEKTLPLMPSLCSLTHDTFILIGLNKPRQLVWRPSKN